MKRTIQAGAALAGLSFILVVFQARAAIDPSARGSIRGGVYVAAGDGRPCPAPGAAPVPGVALDFATGGISITLFSGSDGTYGLTGAGQGLWLLTARPDPASWVVSSTNPLPVLVGADGDLVRTGVNFCLAPAGGNPPASPATAGAAAGNGTAAVTTPPTDPLQDRLTLLAAQSQALLTTPPESRPPADLADRAATPPDSPTGSAAAWLNYLNLFRAMGSLPPLAESPALTYGSQWHSRYMVVNDRPIAHSENRANPLYDPAGHQAAKNGNIFATTQMEANHIWSINFWVSAPFHLVPILDPALATVGYGRYNEAVGNFHMAAVLDVRSELGEAGNPAAYPLYFPGEGAETWVVRHSLYEWPDPLASCPGFVRPTGPPLVLQLGDGALKPAVTGHTLFAGDRVLESCRFDETNYRNPDSFAQTTGRTILDERDAIVIIPRRPLGVGQSYRVTIEADGQSYSWQFVTRAGPP